VELLAGGRARARSRAWAALLQDALRVEKLVRAGGGAGCRRLQAGGSGGAL
jgi:hypothetical protein